MIDDATIRRVALELGLLPNGEIPNQPVEKFVDYQELTDSLDEFARAIEQLARKEQREEILDDIGEALSYDLENGVKCLNEAAAEKFRDEYPNLIETLDSIRASGKDNSNE